MCIPVIWAFAHKGMHFRLFSSCYHLWLFKSQNCVQLFIPRLPAAHQPPMSSTISQSLLKFMSIKPAMLPNHLILCRPVLLLPSVFPRIRVFSNELSICIRWPKFWSFSFSISPLNKYSGLISFRFDLFLTLAKFIATTGKISMSLTVCGIFFPSALTKKRKSQTFKHLA